MNTYVTPSAECFMYFPSHIQLHSILNTVLIPSFINFPSQSLFELFILPPVGPLEATPIRKTKPPVLLQEL